MKDLWEFYKEMFEDGFWGCIIGIITGLAVLFVIVLISYGIFYVADSAWRPEEKGIGIVSNKEFTPAHTTTTLVMSGKVMIPISTYYPDNYSLIISLGELSDSFSVDENYYNEITIGTKLKILYCHGRMSKSLYIKEIL